MLHMAWNVPQCDFKISRSAWASCCIVSEHIHHLIQNVYAIFCKRKAKECFVNATWMMNEVNTNDLVCSYKKGRPNILIYTAWYVLRVLVFNTNLWQVNHKLVVCHSICFHDIMDHSILKHVLKTIFLTNIFNRLLSYNSGSHNFQLYTSSAVIGGTVS